MTARSIQHYGFTDPDRPAWTGPVERVDSAALRRPCIQLTWRCQNVHCGQWTMNGSYRTGRCCFCQTPRFQ